MKSFLKYLLTSSIIWLAFFHLLSAQVDFNPGKSRWAIKTSVVEKAKHKKVKLPEILTLPFPEGIKQNDKRYQDKLIPAGSLPSELKLKEGDIVTVTGWLHLVALEKDREKQDGDYHIQITNNPVWGDSCFIVEIPYEDFVSDPELSGQCKGARMFVRDRLLKGKEPLVSGNVMRSQVYVKVTGQLFLDAAHKTAGARGKKDKKLNREMKSYTSWEIHPVTEIVFAKKPK